MNIKDSHNPPPTPEKSSSDSEIKQTVNDADQILARDLADRFKRITGEEVIVTRMWQNRRKRKDAVRSWGRHPACVEHAHERDCIRCRLHHARELKHGSSGGSQHECSFGRQCVFLPVQLDGHYVAVCKLALTPERDLKKLEHFAEILDILAENVVTRHHDEFEEQITFAEKLKNASSKKDRFIGEPNKNYCEFVRRAIEVIESSFKDPNLTVANAARRIGVNRDYLSHQFRLQTGRRMSRYIFARRMQYACHLLRSTNLQIRQVALSSGFLNTDWFSHTFHEYEGITPTQYRRAGNAQSGDSSEKK